ncbi:hypothetical protein SAM23877_p033 (plasmid) [Streptomyces ambofaciens ATCC 23877]|uniref:Uncharacterized protein n=1 Tax=Streptomyces ambofaciens (strain ATCC 23877 / 3486 / DSM 40053 / JCM 4204 / NBRC 12836 / NRRL B-2516) TaxID=278992 RepID=A0A0K2B6P7_STRA7|nr:hypothetical protein [Streptomyces ambofaciens]AKZ60742.1 hypothetical protein SAM23877_p033 [Streptomyces ambofaciens ATCC 23877]
MAPSPEPQAVDYNGRPLHVGDTVAYIGIDPVRLCEGRVVVTSPRNICIESGPHLITFSGHPASLGTPPPRPLDGTVTRNKQEQEPFQYPQVALTDTENRYSSVGLYVGDRDLPADVVQGEMISESGPRVVLDENERRHQAVIDRVDELLAVIERVRAFAARLEEFAENALRDDDRKLYAAVASDLRARIDREEGQ